MGEQDYERTRVAALYRSHGMVQPSERVWRDGVDVTAEPPRRWVPSYRWYAEGWRGVAEQQHWLRVHAQAVADQGGLA